ncbi:hypothetical protein [Natronosalvus caseinilyticus]|uniref:hypothetical protein n=1 Tax=Natronosalvus caseinilyticus TaxID=2953747 RepID=UPI0028B08D31|nr:hypothetical protein [Natronosalvus caseinilyticus]
MTRRRSWDDFEERLEQIEDDANTDGDVESGLVVTIESWAVDEDGEPIGRMARQRTTATGERDIQWYDPETGDPIEPGELLDLEDTEADPDVDADPRGER